MVFLSARRLGRIGLFLLLMMTACTGVFFQPMREHALTPEAIGLTWRDVWFQADDGVQLHGWFLPAEGQPRGSLIFLHGNAQNISTHLGSVAWLPAAGFNVFLADYRGYGRSEGVATLDGLHRDGEAMIATGLMLEGVDPHRVALFGQSLGGSIAIATLSRSPHKPAIRALIVEGAFADYRQITREVLARSWLTWPLQWPLSLTIDNSWQPERDIAAVAPTPVLIIHGTEDTIVPPTHAQALWAAAGAPKALWLVAGAGHIGALRMPELRRRFVSYLIDCAFADSDPPIGCDVNFPSITAAQ